MKRSPSRYTASLMRTKFHTKKTEVC